MTQFKELAKDFVTSYFGVRETFFETAWKVVNKNYDKLATEAMHGAELSTLGSPLGIAGPERSEAVKAIVVFVGAERELQSGATGPELSAAVERLCKRYELNERVSDQILHRMEDLVKEMERLLQAAAETRKPGPSGTSAGAGAAGQTDYLVFLSHPSGVGVVRRDATEHDLQEKWLSEKLKRDIFVYSRTVYARFTQDDDGECAPELIEPDENVFKLLVIFLRQKDTPLPAYELYQRVWADSAHHDPRLSEPDATLMQRLKGAVSQLREVFEGVKGFRIPPARGRQRQSAGSYYLLEGDFTFCLIYPKHEDRKYLIDQGHSV